MATSTYYITVSDSLGTVATDSITITVDTNCCKSLAGFGLTNSYYCIGDSIYITNTSTAKPGATYEWSFIAGAIPVSYSGITPPPIVYTADGMFEIQLIVNDSCGSDTAYKNVFIFPLPYAQTGSDTTLCKKDTFILGDAPVSGY